MMPTGYLWEPEESEVLFDRGDQNVLLNADIAPSNSGERDYFAPWEIMPVLLQSRALESSER